ncbi:MAG: transporter [Flavobacteriales bacterium]|nr:MAG: transporter [Flavobacteriales bacterium]
MENIEQIITKFEPISLEEMDSVRLLNRTDTKYLMSIEQMLKALEDMAAFYRILEIEKKRTNNYQTLYFDTPDFRFYHSHHNGKLNRRKVRFRKYLDSDLCYLEIKFKNNKERTIKKRTKAADFESVLSEKSKKFIEANSPISTQNLEPKLQNQFTRLTFVHKTAKERLTIDLRLKFKTELNNSDLSNIVIAELKQEKQSSRSDFINVMRKYHIRPMRISKYCIGTALLNKDLKINGFKPKLLALKKIANGTI